MTHTLATPEGSVEQVGLPDRAQAAAISPTEPVWAPQDHVESVLLAHLRTHRVAQVRYATELVALDQDDDDVRATVHDRARGAMMTVSARFVVAADGAHSAVRNALGIPMHGPDRLLECVTALFEAPLWEVVGERRYGVYWIEHAEAKGNFLPAGGDRWLYGRVWEPGRERVADYPADRLIRLIRLGAGVPELAPRLLRMGAYSFAAQLADRFRDRRVFLAGDAAHRITPRGGTGMNTAIHDGYDLGWKLAWTLHGWAGPELLDSYEAERRPWTPLRPRPSASNPAQRCSCGPTRTSPRAGPATEPTRWPRCAPASGTPPDRRWADQHWAVSEVRLQRAEQVVAAGDSHRPVIRHRSRPDPSRRCSRCPPRSTIRAAPTPR